MMIEIDAIFQYQKPVPERLLAFGFQPCSKGFLWKTPVFDDQFLLQVAVDEKGQVDYTVTDQATQEEYILIKSESAQGNFVTELRRCCRQKLEEIASACFVMDEFQAEQTRRIIGDIQARYDVQPEYLWEGVRDSAALRHKTTLKWFGVLMTIDFRKLDSRRQGSVDILVVKSTPEDIESVVGRPGCYPAYHMNKKHWLTLVLNGTLSDQEIQAFVDKSFALTKEKGKKRQDVLK